MTSGLQLSLQEISSYNMGRNQPKSLKNKANSATNNQFQYRGMTLKEYFRVCDEDSNNQINGRIEEMVQQAECSSKQAQTPGFGFNNNRQKMKTEIHQGQHQKHQKKSHQIYPQLMRSGENSFKNKFFLGTHLKVNAVRQGYKMQSRLERKNNFHERNNTHEKSNKKQRVVSIPDRDYKKQEHKRSTLASFYQFDKKKKMLSKIKQDKEKANQLKVNDIFYITKYAKKFNMPQEVAK